MREGHISLSEKVQASLKAFDKFFGSLPSKLHFFPDNSVHTTTKILYDVGLCDRIDNKDENIQDYSTYNSRQEKNSEAVFFDETEVSDNYCNFQLN